MNLKDLNSPDKLSYSLPLGASGPSVADLYLELFTVQHWPVNMLMQGLGVRNLSSGCSLSPFYFLNTTTATSSAGV